MSQGKLWIGSYGLLQKISWSRSIACTHSSQSPRIKAGGIPVGRQGGMDAHCPHWRSRLYAQLFAQLGTCLRHHVKQVGLASNHSDVSDRLSGESILQAQVETDAGRR